MIYLESITCIRKLHVLWSRCYDCGKSADLYRNTLYTAGPPATENLYPLKKPPVAQLFHHTSPGKNWSTSRTVTRFQNPGRCKRFTPSRDWRRCNCSILNLRCFWPIWCTIIRTFDFRLYGAVGPAAPHSSWSHPFWYNNLQFVCDGNQKLGVGHRIDDCG